MASRSSSANNRSPYEAGSTHVDNLRSAMRGNGHQWTDRNDASAGLTRPLRSTDRARMIRLTP